jgi:hypothetical protein
MAAVRTGVDLGHFVGGDMSRRLSSGVVVTKAAVEFVVVILAWANCSCAAEDAVWKLGTGSKHAQSFA